MAQSTGVKMTDAQNKILERIYTEDERKQYSFIVNRIKNAYNDREQKWEYFDGLTYSQDYRLNRQAANTYLRPKKNDDEVRINTGTTEKKIETVQNELLAMNLQPEVQAFDLNDTEIADLGDNFTDIVRRTNEIEKDDDFYVDAIRELLTQRAVFIRENYVRRVSFDKQAKAKFTTIELCEKELISGLKVFLGNIKIPSHKFHTQPYFSIVDNVSHRILEQQWKDNKYWEHVRSGVGKIGELSDVTRIGELENEIDQVVYYYSYPDDEYQVFINGVMMLPVDSSLPNNFPEYNVKMITLKSMDSDFAYGKPLTASAKTLQALDNETIRLLVRKFRQALEPPMGVKGNKVYSRDIWNPGAVTQGITKEMFSKLIDHEGVSNGDITMFKLIEDKVEEFIGSSDLAQGLEQKGMTATQAVEQLKQAMKNLGLAVFAVMRMKRDMAYLRIYNVLENYLDPVSKRVNGYTNKVEDVYRKFTLRDTDIGNGKMGKKIVSFTNQDMSAQESAIKEFEEEQDKMGKPVRLHYIDVNKLRELNLMWFVAVNEKQRQGSSLEKVLFKDKLEQGVVVSKISGRPLAGDKVIENFERTWQAKDWFEDKNQMLPNEINPEESVASGQLRNGTAGPATQKPSLNTLMGQIEQL